MTICTDCGFKSHKCRCKGAQITDIHYYNGVDMVSRRKIDNVTKNCMDIRDSSPDMSKQFKNTVQNLKPTATNVRKVAAWAVMSIQTSSVQADRNTNGMFTNFGELKQALENSTDGLKKWEKVGEWWTSDMPKKVAKHLKNDEYLKAQLKLSGIESGKTTKEYEQTYIRTVKANFITSLFGDPKALCMDSRRRRALSGILGDMLDNSITHPSDRQQFGEYNQRSYKANSHNADPDSGKFWEDMLMQHPKQYRLITGKIMDMLDGNMPGVSRELIPQLVFNMAGTDTYHPELLDWLETE